MRRKQAQHDPPCVEDPRRVLTVLYDGRCGFCRQLRRWAERQLWARPIVFLPQQHPAVRARFAGVLLACDALGRATELVVVEADGRVLRGTPAYLAVFAALRRYRWLAWCCLRPRLAPWAERFFLFAAAYRHTVSRLLRLRPEPLAQALEQRGPRGVPQACPCPLERSS